MADNWQVITEMHESQATGYWMAVHNGRVVWRGLGEQAVDIAYAIVSLNQFTEKTKVLMKKQYEATIQELCRWRDVGNMPPLPLEVLDMLEGAQ